MSSDNVNQQLRDWSNLLYNSEGYTQPRIPVKGMALGQGSFKSTGIGTWVRTLNIQLKKSVELRKGSNSIFKSWRCTCKECSWYLSIGRKSADKEANW